MLNGPFSFLYSFIDNEFSKKNTFLYFRMSHSQDKDLALDHVTSLDGVEGVAAIPEGEMRGSCRGKMRKLSRLQ